MLVYKAYCKKMGFDITKQEDSSDYDSEFNDLTPESVFERVDSPQPEKK
jgi:hypothetical protein